MEDRARERLALNAYLAQLENLHVAFGVKQKTPETLDAAVSATLELESYVPHPKADGVLCGSGPLEGGACQHWCCKYPCIQ